MVQSRTKENFSDLREKTQSKAETLTDKAQSKIEEFTDKAQATAEDALDRIQDARMTVEDSLVETVQTRPLTTLALALGIGFIFGTRFRRR